MNEEQTCSELNKEHFQIILFKKIFNTFFIYLLIFCEIQVHQFNWRCNLVHWLLIYRYKEKIKRGMAWIW